MWVQEVMGNLEKSAQSQQTGQPCRADKHIEQIGYMYIQYVSIVHYRQARQLGNADMEGCYIKATRLQVGMGTKYVQKTMQPKEAIGSHSRKLSTDPIPRYIARQTIPNWLQMTSIKFFPTMLCYNCNGTSQIF